MTSEHPLIPAETTSPAEERELRDVFFVAIFLKGLSAIFEFCMGALLYFVGSAALLHFVMRLTRNELLDDPHDFFSTTLVHTAQGYATSGSSFVALYLMFHGFVKSVLIAFIMRGYRFAYPAYASVMSVLIVYQLYRVATHHSAWLLLFTVFDIIVTILVVHEYFEPVRHRTRQEGGKGK